MCSKASFHIPNYLEIRCSNIFTYSTASSLHCKLGILLVSLHVWFHEMLNVCTCFKDFQFQIDMKQTQGGPKCHAHNFVQQEHWVISVQKILISLLEKVNIVQLFLRLHFTKCTVGK